MDLHFTSLHRCWHIANLEWLLPIQFNPFHSGINKKRKNLFGNWKPRSYNFISIPCIPIPLCLYLNPIPFPASFPQIRNISNSNGQVPTSYNISLLLWFSVGFGLVWAEMESSFSHFLLSLSLWKLFSFIISWSWNGSTNKKEIRKGSRDVGE